MQDDCLKQAFYKRQKQFITATVGTSNITLTHVALKLWWRCNYINYGNTNPKQLKPQLLSADTDYSYCGQKWYLHDHHKVTVTKRSGHSK